MNFPDFLRAQPRGRVFALGLALTVFIGAFDYLLPFEATLFMFYAGPILLVAWFGDRRGAILLAVLATFVWYAANLHSAPYTPHGYMWATLNRLVLLVLIAIGGVAMQAQRESMHTRLAALERTRELEEEIVRVSEHEKMRIGQELHDGLCQNLAAIDCAVACLKLDLEEKEQPEAEAAEFIQRQLSQVIAETRELARGIFPVMRNEEGFQAALEELIANTNRLRQISVRLQVRGDIKIKEPQMGMHLYRIAQEALSNAGKHSGAQEVNIELARADDLLTMTIRDNGHGMRNGHTPSRGLGLQTMSYRARSMGGTLDVRPSPAGGTEVRCAVRIPA